jgi:hypothetical protein
MANRFALAIPADFEAARGVYVPRQTRTDRPWMGTVYVRSPATAANVFGCSPMDREGLNVKIIAAISPQLLRLQDSEYRPATVSLEDRPDRMAIANAAFEMMRDMAGRPDGGGLHPVP